jgi:hypothetical protein
MHAAVGALLLTRRRQRARRLEAEAVAAAANADSSSNSSSDHAKPGKVALVSVGGPSSSCYMLHPPAWLRVTLSCAASTDVDS